MVRTHSTVHPEGDKRSIRRAGVLFVWKPRRATRAKGDGPNHHRRHHPMTSEIATAGKLSTKASKALDWDGPGR